MRLGFLLVLLGLWRGSLCCGFALGSTRSLHDAKVVRLTGTGIMMEDMKLHSPAQQRHLQCAPLSSVLQYQQPAAPPGPAKTLAYSWAGQTEVQEPCARFC